MAEHKTSRWNDYKARHWDDSPIMKPEDIKRSILEMRPLHPDLTDRQFAAMYSRKYKVNKDAIIRFLKAVGQ